MSYVSSVLQPDEKIRFVTRIHWNIFIPGLCLGVLALITGSFAAVATEVRVPFLWITVFLTVLALAGLSQAWFKRSTTEIAVTDRRIIYKTGFIALDSNEMQMDKVQSVEVKQTVIGRLLNYGDVRILGAGQQNMEQLKNIESPIEFRNHVTGE